MPLLAPATGNAAIVCHSSRREWAVVVGGLDKVLATTEGTQFASETTAMLGALGVTKRCCPKRIGLLTCLPAPSAVVVRCTPFVKVFGRSIIALSVVPTGFFSEDLDVYWIICLYKHWIGC